MNIWLTDFGFKISVTSIFINIWIKNLFSLLVFQPFFYRLSITCIDTFDYRTNNFKQMKSKNYQQFFYQKNWPLNFDGFLFHSLSLQSWGSWGREGQGDTNDHVRYQVFSFCSPRSESFAAATQQIGLQFVFILFGSLSLQSWGSGVRWRGGSRGATVGANTTSSSPSTLWEERV